MLKNRPLTDDFFALTSSIFYFETTTHFVIRTILSTYLERSKKMPPELGRALRKGAYIHLEIFTSNQIYYI